MGRVNRGTTVPAEEPVAPADGGSPDGDSMGGPGPVAAGPYPAGPAAAGPAAAGPAAAGPAGVLARLAAGRPAGDHRVLLYPWLVSRLVALLILIPENDILRDVIYYGRGARAVAGPQGLRDVLPEYPAPSFALFGPLWWATRGNWYAYLTGFVVIMIALDAAFTLALWRAAGRRPTPGLWLWILLVPLLGPLAYARFDLVPAVFAGGALLAVAARRPATAGLLTGAGAAMKLWPAALLPAMLLRRGGRGRVAAGFLAVGAVAVLATLATAGVSRLVSPLTWQGDRGLQIESLFAVPLLWARLVSPSTWGTPYTRFSAFQVEGPGAGMLADLSTVATAAGLGLLVWLWWRVLRWRQRPGDVLPVAGLLMIGTASLLIITNRTLSPQYLFWVGGLLAALGCLTPAEPTVPRLVRLLLVGGAVTQVIYPIGYALLTNETWATWIGVGLLTARNGVLVAITVIAVRRVVALTARSAVPA